MKTELEELVGETCVCGARKRSMQSFCRKCYRALPRSMQRDLYKRMSEGYEEIYAEAREWLRDEGKLSMAKLGGAASARRTN